MKGWHRGRARWAGQAGSRRLALAGRALGVAPAPDSRKGREWTPSGSGFCRLHKETRPTAWAQPITVRPATGNGHCPPLGLNGAQSPPQAHEWTSGQAAGHGSRPAPWTRHHVSHLRTPRNRRAQSRGATRSPHEPGPQQRGPGAGRKLWGRWAWDLQALQPPPPGSACAGRVQGGTRWFEATPLRWSLQTPVTHRGLWCPDTLWARSPREPGPNVPPTSWRDDEMQTSRGARAVGPAAAAEGGPGVPAAQSSASGSTIESTFQPTARSRDRSLASFLPGHFLEVALAPSPGLEFVPGPSSAREAGRCSLLFKKKVRSLPVWLSGWSIDLQTEEFQVQL